MTPIAYNLRLLERDERVRTHVIEELAELRRQYRISGVRVLEVGCGLGQNLQVFADDNHVVGLDGLFEATLRLRQRGLRSVQCQLEDGLCVRAHSVDWVLCLDVLEHLREPQALMCEIKRVLRAGGKAIIGVPNHFDWLGRLKLMFGHGLDVHRYFPDSDDWNNPHLRFFTPGGLRRLMEGCGLRIAEDRSYRISSLPRVRLLRRLGLRRLVEAVGWSSPALFASGFWLVVERDHR
jgi:SAM-dependent methyltransferase